MTTNWTVLFAVLGVFTIFSLSLSIYILLFFIKLSKGVGRTDLIKILSHLSEIEKENSDSINTINKLITDIKNDVSNHLQKVAITRFNPFSELGGEHSFSLAMLDAHFTGFIITGLHTRERTRIYIKRVDKGNCKQNLSKEEKEVLGKAMR